MMSSTTVTDENVKRVSGYDVESLLASTTLASTSSRNNTSPKVAKDPKSDSFKLRENEYTGLPHQVNSLHTLPLNRPMFPVVGVPLPTPFTLANLGWYSLWQHHANMMNWHYMGNPSLQLQRKDPVITEAQTTTSNLTFTGPTIRTEENPPSNESSLNSNSATESLFAASECHLAVLGDDDGDTPLHIAIVQEDSKLIEKLIGLITFSRLTVNTPNKLMQTPLHLAVLTYQSLVVEKLIKAGGNTNAQDRHGQTPVHLAVEKGYLVCLVKLLEVSNKKTSRTKPAANLEIRNFEGFTPLHIAVRKKDKDFIQTLIQYDANVNSKDGKSGNTPLHHAIDYESCDVMLLLVSRGANINKPNYSGVTPLQSANSSRNEAVSKVLVSQDTTTGPAKAKCTPTNVTTTVTTLNDISKIKYMVVNRSEATKRANDFSSSTVKRTRTNDDGK